MEKNRYPSKEEVEEYYIRQLHTIKECVEHFSISKTKMYACLKMYDIKRTQEDKCKIYTNAQNKTENKEKIKQANLKKYGAVNKNQADSIVKYIDNESFMIREELYSVGWLKKQYLEKNVSSSDLSEELGVGSWILSKICAHYGIKKDSAQRYEIIKHSVQEKYGVTSTLQLKEVKEKSQNSLLKKYGTTNVMSLSQFKDKSKETMLDRYGATNYTQTENYQRKTRATNLAKSGAPYQQQANIRHLDIWLNKSNFEKFLRSFEERPTIANVSDYFGLKDQTAVYDKIHEWRLEDLVRWKPARSRYEDEIVSFLGSLGVKDLLLNERKLLDGKEIDIYSPEYKTGIEFNGDYWHSDIYYCDHNGRSTAHQEKSLLAEKRGIFLFHIFEHEWDDLIEQENIKNRLRTLFVKNEIRIGARKTQIIELSKDQKKEFLNQNHIQGNDHSTKQYGLIYRGELVACMTFVHPKNDKYTWELSRFCNKHGCVVQGGASKLFKYFVTTLKSGDTVSSYNDITKTKGDLYKILGFKCVSVNQPNYVWINFQTGDIRTRYQEQAGGEVKRMHDQGYHRVCDCGTKTWVYTKASE